MTESFARYAITVPGREGPHSPATVVVVHRTEARGPGRLPVYEDDTGRFRVQIIGGVARPLADTDCHGQRCLQAFQMSSPDARGHSSPAL
ncbi:DUF6296 family protein [Yinghuangia sp. ASG 101]|uniref:DUF6296 family protein n=1 Tax=Yinghuangia sp. ASG 101 TaxID=2896848 RepID=UPI001E51211F|nr:DUF6296 family protein [Yinghuangia sp. ASG 101]UGQ12943.1 DUF6296 family protein [Yinghuangia sp. ASG 101]